VIFKTGPWFWNIKGLNQAWGTTSTIGTSWPKAYTASARMPAVYAQVKQKREDGWRRNVKAGISAVFASSIAIVEAIAIMTDSDDTGGLVAAFYGRTFQIGEGPAAGNGFLRVFYFSDGQK